MRGPLLERMPPFEGVRAVTTEGDKGGVAITNGLDNSPDNQSLLNDLSSANNNNIVNSTHENNESVRKRGLFSFMSVPLVEHVHLSLEYLIPPQPPPFFFFLR